MDPACVSVEGRPYKLGQIQEHTIADRERSLECVRCDEAWHVLVAWRHNGRVWCCLGERTTISKKRLQRSTSKYKTYANNINKDSRRFHVAEIARRVVNDFCHGGERGSARETLTYYTDIIEKDSDSRLGIARSRHLAWLLPSLGFVGTVIGIAAGFPRGAGMVSATTTSARSAYLVDVIGYLGLAFDTTLVALLLSVVLVMLIYVTQALSLRVQRELWNTVTDTLSAGFLHRVLRRGFRSPPVVRRER